MLRVLGNSKKQILKNNKITRRKIEEIILEGKDRYKSTMRTELTYFAL